MRFSKTIFITALALFSAKSLETKLQYVGVNEAGGEFGENNLPGIYNKHYIYPNIESIRASVEQGMNVFRMGLRWERFQHELFGEFSEFDVTEYKKVVDATTSMGAVLIIDPHNYARYNDNIVGSKEVPIEAFADFWAKLANIFKDNEKVWFGLVNEPHDMETDDWFKAARAAVDAIRATGATNNILIPGNGWDGAWSWGKEAWYGEANADVALRYFSSEDKNIIFEVHQYFDEDYSGTHDTCIQRPCQNLLKEFVEWLKTNNLKGWVGEIGGTLNDECKECVHELIEYLQENRDYVLGLQWWAAGPWWGHNSYSIEPNSEKAFPGQMAWLKPYLPGPSYLTEVPTFINEKVYCKKCEVTATGGDGSLWGWEDEKSCEIDKVGCGFVEKPTETSEPSQPTETSEPSQPTETNELDPNSCKKFEDLGFKCCSHCVHIYDDKTGLWGVEANEWCGISDECLVSYKNCWSEQYGYPCCDSNDVFLEDELGKWGVMNGSWCGIPNAN